MFSDLGLCIHSGSYEPEFVGLTMLPKTIFDSEVDIIKRTINNEHIPNLDEFRRRIRRLVWMEMNDDAPFEGYDGWKKSST